MSADYLVGRKVTSIILPKSGEDWKWVIALEGDTSITHDGDTAVPTDAIDDTVLGEAAEDGEMTTLKFYSGSPAALVEEVEVITDSIVVKWPGIPELTDQPNAEESRPPDNSADRIATGPVK